VRHIDSKRRADCWYRKLGMAPQPRVQAVSYLTAAYFLGRIIKSLSIGQAMQARRRRLELETTLAPSVGNSNRGMQLVSDSMT
jgi:hypothetical protein